MMPRRKFRLIDTIVLVAAFAVGFAWTRAGDVVLKSLHDTYGYSMDFKEERIARSGNKFHQTWNAAERYLNPCIATATAALALLSLTPPRPGFSRLALRPGVVACWAASFGLALSILYAVIKTLRLIVQYGWRLEVHGHHQRFVWWEELIPDVTPSRLGLAIAAAWFLLVLGRRWRSEPDWLDRSGLLVGCFWVFWATIEAIEPWHFYAMT
jgi:hypothetical protein